MRPGVSVPKKLILNVLVASALIFLAGFLQLFCAQLDRPEFGRGGGALINAQGVNLTGGWESPEGLMATFPAILGNSRGTLAWTSFVHPLPYATVTAVLTLTPACSTSANRSKMNNFRLIRLWPVILPALLLIAAAREVRAEDAAATAAPAKRLADALSPEKWRQVENSVDRALAWIATQQAPDGSFPTQARGQPAVTSLCVMAFLSRGHQPGFGPYGQQLNRAIDFVLSCQREDGLFSYLAPEPVFSATSAARTGSYNHAIAGLMLGEVYGHVSGERARKVRAAIARALPFTRSLQLRPKEHPEDAGGWRYLLLRGPGQNDSDLSVTAWHLMFLRSARNAEFKVPQEYVDAGIAYVRRCWAPKTGMFAYTATANGGYAPSRGTTGAGILSLSMAGQHNTPMALAAGDWLVAHPYESFGQLIGPWDQFFYSTYYCSQAAAQLGGHYWARIFPPIVDAYLKIQEPTGEFPPEVSQTDASFGTAYTTAMAVLALTPAYQLLPVYQR
jgi:hypothetical protein